MIFLIMKFSPFFSSHFLHPPTCPYEIQIVLFQAETKLSGSVHHQYLVAFNFLCDVSLTYNTRLRLKTNHRTTETDGLLSILQNSLSVSFSLPLSFHWKLSNLCSWNAHGPTKRNIIYVPKLTVSFLNDNPLIQYAAIIVPVMCNLR